MAALCPGVQYGLSSQQNFGENKDLIFVKLTDSALRAIEEYIKNQNKFNSPIPTIKFLGNENGELHFPSAVSTSTFSFSMSSTADIEGQGGSFECVEQLGPPRGSLDSLGSIPHKIRIHATEDVYEVTRTRMTEAEDKYKNKCTREIKPNQNDIGRKVKLKQNSRPPVLPIRKDPVSMRDSLLKPSYQPNAPAKLPLVHSSSNGFTTNGLGSNHVSSSKPQVKKPSVPDIAKRPLKERLIHLLALKPFKKVELHDRLMREGLREKNGVSSVLKQISVLKQDNCYHLNRSMWNEIHEDWPFYTESERQILKRRKPQNLTPPGGSDGSSGSGQSPTSTHPGSPPPITSTKRPGFQEGADGFPYKRQRIAHNKVDQVYRQPIETNSQRRPMTDSRDSSNMNPRSRESPTSYFSSFANGMLNDDRVMMTISDDEDGRKRVGSVGSASTTDPSAVCDSLNSNLGLKTFNNCASPVAGGVKMMTGGVMGGAGDTRGGAGDVVNRKEAVSSNEHRINGINGINRMDRMERVVRQQEQKEREKINRYNKVSSSTQNMVARVSPDSQTEGLPPPEIDKTPKNEDEDDFPDYKIQYVTIQDPDQRRRYKTDYMTDYAEYRDLHGIVEKVSKRFALLQDKLNGEDTRSENFRNIQRQIVREYQENKKDLKHQRAKRRFQYLHDKLSHIKRLVTEYDQQSMSDRHY